MTRSWIRLGAWLGLVTALAYPCTLFIPMPTPLLLLVLSLWGVGMSVSSVGLYHLLALDRKSLAAAIGTGSAAVAGVTVTAMLFVQIAIKAAISAEAARPGAAVSAEVLALYGRLLETVHLGLDLWWDLYLCLAAILIAWSMRTHPRFGLPFTVSGLAIALPLAVLNLATAPTPPGSAGLVDLGPLMGLWFLASSIQTLRSLKWVDARLAETST